MMLNRRQSSVAAAVLLATAARPSAAQSATTPAPLEVFFREPVMSVALLSPAGSHVALRTGGKDVRVRLSVLRLDTLKVQVVASFSDADVGPFQWVNDNRLAFALEDRLTAPADRLFAYGLFAVNAQAPPAGRSRRCEARACGTQASVAQRRHMTRPRSHSSAM